jgi:hypothetical protein
MSRHVEKVPHESARGAFMHSPRIPDAVKRIFTETFSARDVAEPLASFDEGVSVEKA